MNRETLSVTCEKFESTHHHCKGDCFFDYQLFEFPFFNHESHVSKSSHEAKSKTLVEAMLHPYAQVDPLLKCCLYALFGNQGA